MLRRFGCHARHRVPFGDYFFHFFEVFSQFWEGSRFSLARKFLVYFERGSFFVSLMWPARFYVERSNPIALGFVNLNRAVRQLLARFRCRASYRVPFLVVYCRVRAVVVEFFTLVGETKIPGTVGLDGYLGITYFSFESCNILLADSESTSKP